MFLFLKNADSEEWLRVPANQDIIKRLRDLEHTMVGACTVVLCLVLRERLYVAYVGNCRALLARFFLVLTLSFSLFVYQLGFFSVISV